MKHTLIYLIILALATACTKVVDLDFGETEKKLVVNCLFSANEPWKLYLTKLKSRSDPADPLVTNAAVKILADDGSVLELRHTGKGVYQSDQYPRKGLNYELRVDVPGYETVSASNTIPAGIEVLDIDYQDRPTTYFFSNTLETVDVAPLSLNLKGETENFVRFRFYVFDSNYGYISCLLPSDSLESLRSAGVPECAMEKLKELTDMMYPYSELKELVNEIENSCDYYNIFDNHVFRKSLKDTSDVRIPENFQIDEIYSDSNWAHNISIDFRTVLGTFNRSARADLFVGYMPAMYQSGRGQPLEYWIDVTGMSEDYYKYQETYIRQAFQAANPYTEVVQVHSNITNGVGIFAGYNCQMFHLYDY